MVDSYAIRKYREVAKSLREQGRTKEAETAERKARELEQKPSTKTTTKTTTGTTTTIVKKKKYHAPSDAERVAREGVGKIQEAFETAQEKKKSELIKEKATKYEAETIKNIDKVRKSPPGSIFKINNKEVSREEALKMLEKNREELAQARITSGRNIGLSTQRIEQLKTEAKQLPAEIKKKKYKVISTKEGLVVVAPKEEKTVGIINKAIKGVSETTSKLVSEKILGKKYQKKTLNVPEVSVVIKKSVEQKPKVGKKLEFEIKEPDYDKMIKQFRKDWSRATTGQKLTLATSAALSKESWEGLGSMVTRSARKREEVMAKHWARVKNQTTKEAFIRVALEAPVSAPMMPLTMFGIGAGSTALLGSVANAGRIGTGLSKVAGASLGAMAVGGTVIELGGIEESWKKGRKEEAIGKGIMLTEAWVGAIAGSLSVRKKIGKKTTKLKLDSVKIRSIRKTEPKTINNVKNLRRVKIVELKYKDPKGKTYPRKNYIYEQETTVRGLTKKRLYLYDTKSKTLRLISNRDAAKLEAILYKSGKTQILYREEVGYSAGVETKKGLFKKVKKTGEITRERIGTREMIVQSTKGQKSVYARSGDILKTSIEGQKKSLKLRPFEEVGIASKKTAVGAGKIKTVGGKIKYSFLEKEYKPSAISDVLEVLTTKPSGKKPPTKAPSTKKISSALKFGKELKIDTTKSTENIKL
ncbi:MAG: hypothetical protein J7L08_02565, partial [Candidatus Aenigmarchaeota archaeon]|nr:hypothetical protein [Candidatus Aenigmarchaeota archaeon]